MSKSVHIENIAAMRRQAGIEDIQLEEKISRLKLGDLVKLTFLTSAKPRKGESIKGETVLVQITKIKGHALSGTLANKPVTPELSHLEIGSPVAFTAANIH